MKPPRSVAETISSLNKVDIEELPIPNYSSSETSLKVGIATPSMREHMTDEGWQIFKGLRKAGWVLMGNNLDLPFRNVSKLLSEYNPDTILLQDKREWDVPANSYRDPNEYIGNVYLLKERDDIFKLTILKDAQQQLLFHRDSAEEIGCHAWVIYYHPAIVKHLAPYVRTKHLIRTYHTVDPNIIPKFVSGKERIDQAVVSGAISSVYPLRQRLASCHYFIRLPHPGYHRNGCHTPIYLRQLSQFKVAVCTSSKYGYTLRKIMEGVVAGCKVVTDLPIDDVFPEIDEYLVRVHPSITNDEAIQLCKDLADKWDEEEQRVASEKAIARFNYETETKRLSQEIEKLRLSYHSRGTP